MDKNFRPVRDRNSETVLYFYSYNLYLKTNYCNNLKLLLCSFFDGQKVGVFIVSMFGQIQKEMR